MTRTGSLSCCRARPSRSPPPTGASGNSAQLVGAPAGYLRQLPAPIAGINLQYGLAHHRAEMIKTYTTDEGRLELRAVVAPPVCETPD